MACRRGLAEEKKVITVKPCYIEYKCHAEHAHSHAELEKCFVAACSIHMDMDMGYGHIGSKRSI